MKSMTGYAKRRCIVDGRNVTIEIKTLNSKQLDINIKAPTYYRSKELELRSMLNTLERGKIDVILSEESNNKENGQLNRDMAQSRYSEIQSFATTIGNTLPTENVLALIFAQPEVWESTQNEEMSEEGWEELRQAFFETIQEVDAFRLQEGEVLATDFVKHINLIEQKLHSIPPYESERIETAKERIRHYFSELAIKEVDNNRFEQEMIYYLEKLDITEEKVRLAKHIDYFRKTMTEESSCGKKLGFVAQEMGREINTTGSKANHIEIQKLVVEMKDELEKIKEQLGNIL